MHAYGVSAYYALPGNQLNGPVLSHSIKIERRSDFNVDNDSRLFFDAQEAKKVSEHTTV